MKTKIILGLFLLPLALLTALRLTETTPKPASEGHPRPHDSGLDSKPTHARRASLHVIGPAHPGRPTCARLLAEVDAETDPELKNELLERVVESVMAEDLPAMLDSLALDTGSSAVEMAALLIRRWAESDPSSAAGWVTLHPNDPGTPVALEQVAIAWANSDLSAATSWVRTLPQDGGKITATLALAYEAARTEPVVALDLASALSPTRERDDLLVHAVSQWVAADFTRASAWAMNVADPLLRQRLVASVAIAVADHDATAAATLAVSGLAQGEEQDRATVSIVQRWAQHSPQAAASWVSQFPDIPLREVALHSLFAIWTSQDPTAVSQWMSELPDGPLPIVGFAAQVQASVDATRSQPSGGSGGEL